MKSSLIRPALALALVAGLSACGGGGKATFTIGGTIGGLEYTGLKLTSNGQEISVNPPAKAGENVSFNFPRQIEYGEEYNVQITQDPLHQDCEPAGTFKNNKDTAGRLAVINVLISCVVKSYAVGGKITGLTAEGLVLANGSGGGNLLVPKDAKDYAMPLPVEYNVTYGIAIIEQPAGLICTVANAAGTMGDANVSNVDITCRPRILA